MRKLPFVCVCRWTCSPFRKIFDVVLTNTGISPGEFGLYTDHRRNTGGLVHLVNGDTLITPQVHNRVDPGETVSTTVTELGFWIELN